MPTIKIQKPPKLPERNYYPFDKVPVGKGFTVKGRKTEGSIRVQASKHNRNGKKFIVRMINNKRDLFVKRIK